MSLKDVVRRAFGGEKTIGLKAAAPFYPADMALYGGLPRTHYSYARDVGEGLDSNVIMSPVMWIMRTFTEATLRVEARNDQDVWKWKTDHPVEMLADRPNESYDGDALWKGTILSFVLNGNAYWRKIRNPFGEVVGLWYIPHWLIRPEYPADGSQFIRYYEYLTGLGPPIRLLPRDVVHFRFGLDPRNPRLGLSPLQALTREVFTDDEAANFSAKILHNMGIPGIVLAPSVDGPAASPDELTALKAYIQSAFTGDNRGKAMIFDRPTDVKQFGFNPQQLNLGDLRDITEERVCAAIGLPAAVVGFGSGMQSTKVGATMRELRRLAWVQCLTPMQTTIGKQVTAQLLPDFQSQTRRFRARFDTSQVGVFEEEEAALVGKVTQMVQAGVLRVDRAQEKLGLEVDDTQKVYLRPSNSLPVDENGDPIEKAKPDGAVDQRGEEEIPPAVLARRNGNGTKPEEEN